MGVLNRHVVVLLAVVLIPTLAQNLYNNVLDENDKEKKVPNYWPLRPPAIPLAVRNPYTNVWSTSSRDQALNSLSPRFWPGNPVGWEGIVTVDGASYEYMGDAMGALPPIPSFKKAIPQNVTFDTQYSNFTFTAGPVIITASFFSPVIPTDTCRSSLPLSYLTTTVEATDGKPHFVRFYSDVSSTWVDAFSDQQIKAHLYKGAVQTKDDTSVTSSPDDDLYSWLSWRVPEEVFGEHQDFPLWGNLSYSTTPMGATEFAAKGGYTDSLRFGYLMNTFNLTQPSPRIFGNVAPVYAFAHDFTDVSNVSVRYTVGTIQDPIIQYLQQGGLAKLKPWWQKCYGGLHDMMRFHWDDFDEAQALGAVFEAKLQADVNSFYGVHENFAQNNGSYRNLKWKTNGTDQYGHKYEFDQGSTYGFLDPETHKGIAVPFISETESYYAIVALSARQVMGAYVYAVHPGGGSDPLMFQKEISSNGNMNTVDVLYPVSPFFLYTNPALLRYLLQPVWEMQEGGLYPHGYCMHDIGAHFPNATGHVGGDDEYMPVEESGNIIIMTYAYYKFTGDVDYLRRHYSRLLQFSEYLVRFCLVPAAQLSTDDFAGTLANQTNLALKGIIGIHAMATIARLLDEHLDAALLTATARSYYKDWEGLAIDPSGKHTMLAYQWRSSWGLLYNVFYDKLLNMGLLSPSLYKMQSSWYETVSQAYGVPLDSRSAQTKSDWAMWAASSGTGPTRRLVVNALAYWLNQTTTEHAFSDLFMSTGDGDYPSGVAFKARPVAGGHYSLLALRKTGQHASAEAGDTAGSFFVKNGTDALKPEQQGMSTPAGTDGV